MLRLALLLIICMRLGQSVSNVNFRASLLPRTSPVIKEYRADGCLAERWQSQYLDHFAYRNSERYEQRYFICDRWWSWKNQKQRGPIFFYAGNEADVTAYVNATGLMWENAEEFGALLVFAEHRYYGASQPFGPESWRLDPSYLTSEQALADYASLIWNLTRSLPGAASSPVIAFGGSYGGMLATWLRLKYPHLVSGAIAASAPIGAFPGVPGFKPSTFWEVVTRDATAAAGAAPECADNVRAAFAAILSLRSTEAGRAQLATWLRLCNTPDSEDAVFDVAYWMQGAFDAYAMGNYPYPSDYITGDPQYVLPAWPMRSACEHMRGQGLGEGELIQALRDAVSLLYNVTGVTCYKLDTIGPAAAGGDSIWDYQYCTEMMAQEQPYFPTTGTTDMFWDQGPFDLSAVTHHCNATWGVEPRPHWSVVEFGGLDLPMATNIVLSNGLYDPWSAFGILKDVSDSVVAVIIPEGAHHLDLMFSHPDDPPSVVDARKVELKHIRRWVEHDARHRPQGTGAH